MSRPHFFYDTKDGVHSAFGTSWTYLPFGVYVRNMIIIAPYNTNTDDLMYSWDGQNIAGRVPVSSYALNLQNVMRNGIYIQAKTATQDGTITAY